MTPHLGFLVYSGSLDVSIVSDHDNMGNEGMIGNRTQKVLDVIFGSVLASTQPSPVDEMKVRALSHSQLPPSASSQ